MSSGQQIKSKFTHENRLKRQGFRVIAGVDEVGRGAWAGPLVAVAVIMPFKSSNASWHKLVKDSKKLSAKTRQRIFDLAKDEIDWAVGLVESQAIDEMGLARANKRAVALAVRQLKITPDFVLADYVARLGETIANKPAQTIIHCDARVFSIALASIFAKVHRDQLMAEYETKHPGYGFAKHKGYGTPQHARALNLLGPCLIHRRTYRPVKLAPAIMEL
jgi:ribonuclease HII